MATEMSVTHLRTQVLTDYSVSTEPHVTHMRAQVLTDYDLPTEPHVTHLVTQVLCYHQEGTGLGMPLICINN